MTWATGNLHRHNQRLLTLKFILGTRQGWSPAVSSSGWRGCFSERRRCTNFLRGRRSVCRRHRLLPACRDRTPPASLWPVRSASGVQRQQKGSGSAVLGKTERCSGTSTPHLDAKTWTWSKTLDANLIREVPWRAPAEAVVSALYHHGAGGLAVVKVEADGVDENHWAHRLVHHHRAQIDAILEGVDIVRDKGGRRPGGTWRHGRLH